MNVSPDALRKETIITLREVEVIIDSVKKEAAALGIGPEAMRNHHGGWVIAPLLVAKATCLSTLVLLNEPKLTTKGN